MTVVKNKLFRLVRDSYTNEKTFFEFGVANPEGCATAINWGPNKIDLIEHYTLCKFLAVYIYVNWKVVPLKN